MPGTLICPNTRRHGIPPGCSNALLVCVSFTVVLIAPCALYDPCLAFRCGCRTFHSLGVRLVCLCVWVHLVGLIAQRWRGQLALSNSAISKSPCRLFCSDCLSRLSYSKSRTHLLWLMHPRLSQIITFMSTLHSYMGWMPPTSKATSDEWNSLFCFWWFVFYVFQTRASECLKLSLVIFHVMYIFLFIKLFQLHIYFVSITTYRI